MKFPFQIPPHPPGRGRPQLEYVLMPEAERLIEKLSGRENDLLSATEFAALVDTFPQWLRDAVRVGRGPKPSVCGRRVMVRGGDIIDWLRFLVKVRKRREQKAVA